MSTKRYTSGIIIGYAFAFLSLSLSLSLSVKLIYIYIYIYTMEETIGYIPRLGRPKKLVDRKVTTITLSSKHYVILDRVKNGVSSNSEIMRILIEDLENDNKYSRLLHENIMLKRQVENFIIEIKELKRSYKTSERAKYDGEILDRAKKAFKIRLAKGDPDIVYTPLWIETMDKLKVDSEKLKNLIKKG